MRLVRQGGEVDAHSLPRLVDRALALGFAFRADDLVAVGGVKRPNAGHRARVFASAGVAMDPGKFEFELGWVYVIPDARDQHVSTRLVEALMQNIGEAQVYATSRVNNDRMHALFARLEFAPVGEPYPSKLNEPNIQLFVRERHTHGADDNEPGADG